MRLSPVIKSWPVILVLGILLLDARVSTLQAADWINNQFLEVINDSNELVTIMVQRRRGYNNFEQAITVAPRTRKHFSMILEPDYQNLSYRCGSVNVQTAGIQVNNYGEKAFLHGKRLEIKIDGTYSIKRIVLTERYKGYDEDYSYLSGEWRGKDSTFMVEIKGNKITWIGKGTFAGNDWIHKGWGTINGNIITAEFEDLPGSHWKGKKRDVEGTISKNKTGRNLIIKWKGIHVTWNRAFSW